MFRQVLPSRIHFLNENDLFLASPSLQLLFTANPREDKFERFVIYQAVNLVLLRKALDGINLMLDDAAIEKSGHAHIECARLAHEDVHPESVIGTIAHGPGY